MIVPTMLTVLRVRFSCDALMRIIQVPRAPFAVKCNLNPQRLQGRLPVPAELWVDRVDGWVGQVNSRRVRRPAGLAGYRYRSGAVSLVVCDDPRHREQTGSGRPGAKGLLRSG